MTLIGHEIIISYEASVNVRTKPRKGKGESENKSGKKIITKVRT